LKQEMSECTFLPNPEK